MDIRHILLSFPRLFIGLSAVCCLGKIGCIAVCSIHMLKPFLGIPALGATFYMLWQGIFTFFPFGMFIDRFYKDLPDYPFTSKKYYETAMFGMFGMIFLFPLVIIAPCLSVYLADRSAEYVSLFFFAVGQKRALELKNISNAYNLLSWINVICMLCGIHFGAWRRTNNPIANEN